MRELVYLLRRNYKRDKTALITLQSCHRDAERMRNSVWKFDNVYSALWAE